MNPKAILGKRRQLRPKGVTLVEMLVVMGIIVILALLVLGGMTRARSTARAAVCTSNLRQLGAAMISYANDKSGQLPPLEDRTGTGANGTVDTLKGIWPQIIAGDGYLAMAPSKSGLLGTSAGVWACPDCVTSVRYIGGYGVAEGTVMKVKRLSAPNAAQSLRLDQITHPERTWLVGDAANTPDIKTAWYAIWANPATWASSHPPAARHNGKVNVCMADGHVESLTTTELKAKDYTMRTPQ